VATSRVGCLRIGGKLEAARKAGYDKAITFEFSHFMSPQSMYPSAHHLYDRYLDYINNIS
jgi:hypothetical protein